MQKEIREKLYTHMQKKKKILEKYIQEKKKQIVWITRFWFFTLPLRP